MKKIIFPLLFPLLFLGAYAQETGMHFEHNSSWQKILEKAKAENKYVFVDCYTSWCGPCKMMANTVFPDKAVGDFYNANYVNAKFQLDENASDNAEIKERYEDNRAISKKYAISSFPTYLIFNPNGELVHRFLGFNPAEEFLNLGKAVLKPENQYYTQLAKFKAGEKSTEFLHHLATMAQDASDTKNLKEITDAYMGTQTNMYTQANLELIMSNLHSSKDKGFKMLMDDPAKVDSFLGQGTAVKIRNGIILQEEMGEKVFGQNVITSPDWPSLQIVLSKKYPADAPQIIAYAKMRYYKYKNNWNDYGTAFFDYMNTYGSNLSNMDMNEYCWPIFENVTDMAVVESALKWMKLAVESSDKDFQIIDTYANLLMKSGKKNEAVDWETKAVAFATEKKDPIVPELEKTLNKMKAQLVKFIN